MFTSPDEVAAYIRDNDVEYVDVRFCDLPGVMQHFTIPASTFGEDTFTDGLGFDGSSIRGFQAINESDMLLLPDANSAFLDPFRAAQDAERELLHPRPDHARGLQPRPAQRGEEGRGLPGQQRHRRHRVLRPRGRVLHLRLDPALDRHQRGLLPHRLGRGLLELRRADRRERRPQPGLQDPGQGRLLPGRALRPLQRPALDDDDQPDQRRAWSSSAVTTRSAPAARPRSTTSSTRCCARPTA